ncbi:efflux RND transporter periplasmic adaptor subunit [Pseudomonas sp. L5B5]|uniref:efflux RND transporter periplasmic adaptor subunit n=1 Tax=Pseudomonas sp. L5B5 TaxID=2883205 RepID=UPI00072FC21B|nr:efflux RND transporter periplasmic adaptor subunit [Pseudomonas sp. L5B5]KTC37977.1 RND transporter [Pseudomonas sp. ABAC61]UCZ83870.1 efflux RND transporter periplasmic adaptor subunit [Pseudomonas sp. L5B5]
MDSKERCRALALAAFLAPASLAGCHQSEQPVQEPVIKLVSVEKIAPTRLQLTAQLPGRVEPIRIAQIRARVPGIVTRRHFEEGAEVKVGDLLFEIDPAPMKAALARAQGELAKAGADAMDAQSKIKRYEPLVAINAISSEDFDTAVATLKRAQAAQQSAQADVETARLNLGYAHVRAPISGKIGKAMVTEGALVGQGEASLMAEIKQLDPIYVDFSQSASQAIRLKAALDDGTLSADSDQHLRVQIEDTRYNREGALLFADVAVDPGTGQVTMRGRFANEDRLLLPGMYVRVSAPQGTDHQAVLLPQRAIQRDRQGQAQVWVVNSQNQLELRPVQTGDMHTSRWHIVDGLKTGELVVVSNLEGLSAGDKVNFTPVSHLRQQTSSD